MSKFGLNKKIEYALSEEVAVNQVVSMLEYYEIDVDSMDEKQGDAVNSILENLTRFVRQGRLEIIVDDSGIKCIQTLAKNSEIKITYKEIDGRAKTAMGTKKDADQNGRLYAVMGALSDGEAALLKLKGPDVSLVENLGAVFLLV